MPWWKAYHTQNCAQAAAAAHQVRPGHQSMHAVGTCYVQDDGGAVRGGQAAPCCRDTGTTGLSSRCGSRARMAAMLGDPAC